VVALVSSVAATLGVAGALEREDRAGVPSASTRAAPSSARRSATST
jgi:hypothetical protein